MGRRRRQRVAGANQNKLKSAFNNKIMRHQGWYHSGNTGRRAALTSPWQIRPKILYRISLVSNHLHDALKAIAARVSTSSSYRQRYLPIINKRPQLSQYQYFEAEMAEKSCRAIDS